MGRNAMLSECAQQLRDSAYEYETLLATSIERVWTAMGQHVEAQLQGLAKGVNVAGFAKFALLRDQSLATPVFVLADRFASSYSVVWKKPPPALLMPTIDLNMSVLGQEIALSKELTQRSLEAILLFLGTKLQKGTASGRLSVGRVGCLCLEGRTLSFQFDAGFLRALANAQQQREAAKKPQQQVTKRLLPMKQAQPEAVMPIEAPQQQPLLQQEDDSSSSRKRGTWLVETGGSWGLTPLSEEKRHRHRHESHRTKTEQQRPRSSLTHSVSTPVLLREARRHHTSTDADYCLLPRFLLHDARLPVEAAQTSTAAKDSFVRRAYDDERMRRQQEAELVQAQEQRIAERHHATQMRRLQERAEHVIEQRDLNAFLSGQMQEKQTRQEAQAAEASRALPYDAVRILPRDPIVSAATKRARKQTLCRHLDGQVEVKAALRKHNRTVEQAEAAFFIAQLSLQDDKDQQELKQWKRREKERLLGAWRQQQALQQEPQDVFRKA